MGRNGILSFFCFLIVGGDDRFYSVLLTLELMTLPYEGIDIWAWHQVKSHVSWMRSKPTSLYQRACRKAFGVFVFSVRWQAFGSESRQPSRSGSELGGGRPFLMGRIM
ncbi:hypothetical protein B0H63DRAFT_459411 [Podospora didyma]|uniref:Uncharacterized protein n=1 Tax=Podospora didyma TaxID=330526 RepID=A0AAE0U7H3_9PEZI|nr:hypothetical protein B0H63DRAFT_459411 [Podospora didyma]